MTAERVEALDIDNMPELVRLVDQVQRTGTARVLTRGGRRAAVLRPKGARQPDASRRSASLSAIAGWDRSVDAVSLRPRPYVVWSCHYISPN